jgi:hypothetical protein
MAVVNDGHQHCWHETNDVEWRRCCWCGIEGDEPAQPHGQWANKPRIHQVLMGRK